MTCRGPPRPGRRRPHRPGARPGRRSGEISTGSEISWPITRGVHRRSARWPATCGSEPDLGERRLVVPTVWPRSEPATSAPYTGAGSRLLRALLGDGDGLEPGVLLPWVLELHAASIRRSRSGREAGQRALGAGADRAAGSAAEHHRLVAGRRWPWSGPGWRPGRGASPASARSPYPCTHSGSGPSSGRPVKNFAAMHPPRQES